MDSQNEIVIAHFQRLTKQINLTYQAMHDERRQIAQWEETQEFSVLGEVELLTAHLQGYAGQVLAGRGEKLADVLADLQKMQPFEIEPISNWYMKYGEQYPQMCRYIEILDYLRLSLMEYLRRTMMQVAA